MKHLLLFCFLIGGATKLKAQALSENIVFEERVFSFGTIEEEKGKVSHTFIFKNNGKQPVTIGEIYSACGCIGKVNAKGAIPPQGKGNITITFNPAYKSGFFSKEIVVYSEDGQRYNRIWVEGNIIAGEKPVTVDYPYDFGNGLHLRLKVMAFGYLKPGQSKKLELHYANDSNKEMNLDFLVDGKKDGLLFNSPGRVAAKAKGIITVTYTMPYFSNEDAGFRLFPYVNGNKAKEPLTIKILNEVKASAAGNKAK